MTESEKAVLEKTLKEIAVVSGSTTTAVPIQLKSPKGCEECNVTGYRGQLVISEVLQIDDDIREAILKNAPAREIFAIARKKGMLTLAEDAVLKVVAGQTTLDEVHRVINA